MIAGTGERKEKWLALFFDFLISSMDILDWQNLNFL